MVVTGLGLLFGGRAEPAGRARTRAGRWSRAASRPTGADAADPRRRGRRRARRRRRAAARPHRHAEGRSRAHVGGARCRCRPVREVGERWSPCTASPTSCGCSAPTGSARAGPVRRSRPRKLLGSYREGYAERRAAAAELDRRAPSAQARAQEADLLRSGSTRSAGRPAAGRGRRAARRGAAAGARRGAAAGRASGSRPAGRRPRTRPGGALAASQPLGRAARAGRRRPDDQARSLGGRLAESATWSPTSPPSCPATSATSTPTRPGWSRSTSAGPRWAV